MSDYFYESGKGHGLAHNPFKAIVAPRPIGWISSLSPAGQANLAYLKQGIFDTAGAQPIARCGYRGDYAQVNEIFEMIRPA